jgi:hypothetical protein
MQPQRLTKKIERKQNKKGRKKLEAKSMLLPEGVSTLGLTEPRPVEPPPSYSRPERTFDTYGPVGSRSFSSRSRSPPRRRGGRRDSPGHNGGRRRRSSSYSSYSSYDDRSQSRSRSRGRDQEPTDTNSLTGAQPVKSNAHMPRNQVSLKGMNVNFCPSPTAPPAVPLRTVSPESRAASMAKSDAESDAKHPAREGSNRSKYRPSQGDAVLVSFIDGGKHPNIMRQAGDEPLASDNEDNEHSPNGPTCNVKSVEEKPEEATVEKHGIGLAVLAADALRQSAESATLASEYEEKGLESVDMQYPLQYRQIQMGKQPMHMHLLDQHQGQNDRPDEGRFQEQEDNDYSMEASFDGLPVYGNQLNFPEYTNDMDMDMFAPHQLLLDYSPISDLNHDEQTSGRLSAQRSKSPLRTVPNLRSDEFELHGGYTKSSCRAGPPRIQSAGKAIVERDVSEEAQDEEQFRSHVACHKRPAGAKTAPKSKPESTCFPEMLEPVKRQSVESQSIFTSVDESRSGVSQHDQPLVSFPIHSEGHRLKRQRSRSVPLAVDYNVMGYTPSSPIEYLGTDKSATREIQISEEGPDRVRKMNPKANHSNHQLRPREEYSINAFTNMRRPPPVRHHNQPAIDEANHYDSFYHKQHGSMFQKPQSPSFHDQARHQSFVPSPSHNSPQKKMFTGWQKGNMVSNGPISPDYYMISPIPPEGSPYFTLPITQPSMLPPIPIDSHFDALSGISYGNTFADWQGGNGTSENKRNDSGGTLEEPSGGGGTGALERMKAQFPRFQAMRESNNALAGSISSSTMFHRSSSPPSHNISSMPPIVATTSISYLSSFGQPGFSEDAQRLQHQSSLIDFNDSGLPTESTRSFGDAIDASRGMIAMSQNTTSRNIYGGDAYISNSQLDQGQLWWRAFTELRKEIPETRLHEAWANAHLKIDAHEDVIAHTAINDLIIPLEETNSDLEVSIQQILDIAKVVQSTLDLKTGGFIWTCLSSVIRVSLSPM